MSSHHDDVDSSPGMHELFGGDEPLPPPATSRRSSHRARRRGARRRRTVLALAVITVVGLAVGAWVLTGKLFAGNGGDDYSGTGSGTVTVRVATGDDASAIAATLAGQRVVKTEQAFVDAAKADDRSRNIQPGAYALHQQMSGQAALALLLDPTSRVSKKVVVTEGQIEPVVLQNLANALGVPLAQVQQAAGDIGNLGIPTTYGAPTAAEGFLFPATYSFDPDTAPAKALQQMVERYVSNDRQVGLSDSAAKIGLTPYQVLTIASIAEAEAVFPADYAKVARVLLNRIAAGTSLQVDATSAYAAKLAGLDPTKVVYADIDSPYNTYKNPGLPPTPIGNPGAAAISAALTPAAGDWLFYVNGDAQGHLLFTNDEATFAAASQTCKANGWGCG